MILDKELQLSDGQSITSAADSTNTIDLGVVGGRDIGAGENLYLVINCETTLDADTVTVTIALQGDSTTTITPDATVNLGVIPAATVAGDKFVYRIHPGLTPMNYRYINIRYTPSAGLSAGAFSAYITSNVDQIKHYNDNVTITA